MQYVFAHRYGSTRDGRRFGPWAAGHVEDLDPAEADWINRDSPGACAPVVVGPAEVTAAIAVAPPAEMPADQAEPAPAPAEAVEEEGDVDDEPEQVEPQRAGRPTRDRMNRGGRNRAA